LRRSPEGGRGRAQLGDRLARVAPFGKEVACRALPLRRGLEEARQVLDRDAQLVELRAVRLVHEQTARESLPVPDRAGDLLDVLERPLEGREALLAELRVLERLADEPLTLLERLEDLLQRDRDRVE